MAERTKAKSGPKGTRDLYPLEAARRRFLTETWRKTALNHGFDEVDGPTFETLDLYTVKSGEGIVSELFQAYSGKSPEEVEQVRASGQAPFALRPEFTPTLARMYASKANALPRPTKWFSVGPFFRAERPQRGRLREFLQLNVDVIGLEGDVTAENAEARARMDAECIACCVGTLGAFGLSPRDTRVKVSNRELVADVIIECGVDAARLDDVFALLDKRPKMPTDVFSDQAASIGFDDSLFDKTTAEMSADPVLADVYADLGLSEWIDHDFSIVRGLAYYTGTVFEVIAEGERAVAGGGRYDNLIELFGGPPTPAVGFAMGDVVLTNLLQDKGLMPSDEELMACAGARPDVFVISGGETFDGEVQGLLARLRREGLHARRSYKSTRNVGKLLKEASAARFAVIVGDDVRVKSFDSGDEERVERDGIVGWLLERA